MTSDEILKQFERECKSLGEKVSISTDTSIPKAERDFIGRWGYDKGSKTHHIHLPSDVPEGREKEAVARHETWHGRMTDRDLALLQYSSKHYRINPVTFGVFEDARIDDMSRWTEGTDYGYYSGPDPVYKIPEHISEANGKPTIDHPLVLFHCMDMCEDDPAALREVYAHWGGPKVTHWRGRDYDTDELIRWFLDRARVQPTTRHLWAVLLEWMEAFGGYYDEPSPKEFQAMGIPAPGNSMPGDTKGKGKPGEGQGKEGEGKEGEGKEGKGKDGKDGEASYGWGEGEKRRKPTSNYKPPPKPEDLIKGPQRDKNDFHPDTQLFSSTTERESYQLKLGMVPDISAMLRRMIGYTDASRVRTATEGNRLHLPTAIIGESASFRRNIVRKGKRRICLVVDMSGSMTSAWRDHAAAFTKALLDLHLRGVMHADIWLSSTRGCCKVPYNITDEQFARILKDGGGEGIRATMKLPQCRADVLAADSVFVYTDGCLTDGDTEKDYWRQRGVDMVGVMSVFHLSISELADSGQNMNGLKTQATQHIEHYAEHMSRHFDKYLIRESPIQLASAIVQYLLLKP